ncbi:MAG TPA: nucleoside-diphosphate kinase [Candidatus Saccharimonadales bacterium]|nr:nucleoside-diphosphate kinase [Candidatus Saccharimonadales bacterium]
MIEKSLVILKPDAVQRGIMGELLTRFERTGLKVVAAKMTLPDRALTEKHYLKDETWHRKVGENNLKDCEKFGVNPMDYYGVNDPVGVGKVINEWLFDALLVGPVLAFIIEGPQAVAKIRALVGTTYPDLAAPGTIRGDYSVDSAFASLVRKRSVFNLIHASGASDEAVEEIKLWFKPEEIFSYKRVEDELYNY